MLFALAFSVGGILLLLGLVAGLPWPLCECTPQRLFVLHHRLEMHHFCFVLQHFLVMSSYTSWICSCLSFSAPIPCVLLLWWSLQSKCTYQLRASAFSVQMSVLLVVLLLGCNVPALLFPFLREHSLFWLTGQLEMHHSASCISIFCLVTLNFGRAPCWTALPAPIHSHSRGSPRFGLAHSSKCTILPCASAFSVGLNLILGGLCWVACRKVLERLVLGRVLVLRLEMDS